MLKAYKRTKVNIIWKEIPNIYDTLRSYRNNYGHPSFIETYSYLTRYGRQKKGVFLFEHRIDVGNRQTDWIITVRALAKDRIVFVGVFFSVSTITDEPLHLA